MQSTTTTTVDLQITSTLLLVNVQDGSVDLHVVKDHEDLDPPDPSDSD